METWKRDEIRKRHILRYGRSFRLRLSFRQRSSIAYWGNDWVRSVMAVRIKKIPGVRLRFSMTHRQTLHWDLYIPNPRFHSLGIPHVANMTLICNENSFVIDQGYLFLQLTHHDIRISSNTIFSRLHLHAGRVYWHTLSHLGASRMLEAKWNQVCLFTDVDARPRHRNYVDSLWGYTLQNINLLGRITRACASSIILKSTLLNEM